MAKGARTVVQLDNAVRHLQGRDLTRAKDVKEIRAELVEIRALLDSPPINVEKLIMDDLREQLAARDFKPSPELLTPIPSAPSGTALERARLFFRKWFG